MNTPPPEGKPFWKDPLLFGVFVGSSLLFVGLCFGFLRVLTELPLWACVLIALPLGVAAFAIILWLQICSDAPPRPTRRDSKRIS
jgi:hypothetical protein